jgi:hypothetical protein
MSTVVAALMFSLQESSPLLCGVTVSVVTSRERLYCTLPLFPVLNPSNGTLFVIAHS